MPRPSSLLLSLLLALPLAAQQHETIEVRLLEIDVTVADRKGNPVHDLTPADFELFENGKRQNVTNLSEYRETESRAATPQPAGAPAPAAQVEKPRPRTIVLLVDTLPLRGAESKHLFATIRTLLERALRPGDRVDVLGWVGSGFAPVVNASGPEAADTIIATLEKSLHAVNTDVTADTEAIFFKQIAETAPTGKTGIAINAGAEIAASKRNDAEDEFSEMNRKTASMLRIVSSLHPAGGKTIVVYVSERFPRVAGKRSFVGPRATAGAPNPDEQLFDTTRMIEAVVRAANANGVPFYALRPNIPTSLGTVRTLDEEAALMESTGAEALTDQLTMNNELEALKGLTEPTGGGVGIGPSGIEHVVDLISRDLGSYYSLGWRAQSNGTDRERKIVVKAKNPNYVVRSRASFVEKSDRTRATDLLIARLFEGGTSGNLDFEAKVGEKGKPSGQRVLLPVELTIPVDQLKFVADGKESAARFSVLTVAGASIGNFTKVSEDSRRVVAGEGGNLSNGFVHYSFEVMADRKPTTVAVGVYDENSGLLGVRTIALSSGSAIVSADVADPAAAAAWHEALARADNEKKPLVVFFRPKRCGDCDVFQRDVVPHPTIGRRTSKLVFATIPFSKADVALPWSEKDAGIAVFDRTHTVRATWTGVPDTTTLGLILDAAIAAGPHFERAIAADAGRGPYAGASEVATGLIQLGRPEEARAYLQEAIAKGAPDVGQLASVSLALLDASEKSAPAALERLDAIVAAARTPDVAAEAWMAIAIIQRALGHLADAENAFRQAADLAGSKSPTGIAAGAALASLASTSGAPQDASTVVKIMPPDDQIVTGRQTVRALVNSPAVARVVFTVDAKEIASVTRPPFSTPAQFSRIPQTQTIGAVAYDFSGAEIGRDERRVNDAGDVFWIRLHEPTVDPSGAVPVSVALRVPSSRRVESVTVSWNDESKAVLTVAPLATTMTTSIKIPPQQVGVLKVVAKLDDGRTAEDAIPLNAGAYVERTEVQLVELPVTITEGGKPLPSLNPTDLVVQEGRARKVVESIAAAADSPVTVGILIDTSASMYNTLPDVQEAAIRFLDAVLRPTDRAFVVNFDSKATLVQPATADREALRRAIMHLSASGLTALHDAIILGLLQFEGIKGRRALVVFTDGFDVSSRYTAEDLRRLSQRMNVPVYAIAPELRAASIGAPGIANAIVPSGPGRFASVPPTQASPAAQGLEDLKGVARASGGQMHEVKALNRLDDVYGLIAEALRAQMLITIRTAPGTSDNEWRPVTVSAAARNLDVRAPAGYYAPR
jgi:Ca-activated chloride channel homolog